MFLVLVAVAQPEALLLNTLCAWDARREGVRPLPGTEAPPPWEYAEANPFSASSTAFTPQLSEVARALEGLAQNGELDPIQQAWIDEQVPQCGYCQNGQIMTAKALLDRNPNPTDAEIRAGMEGALCRCMSYFRIQAAIRRVIRQSDGGAGEGAEA